MLDNSLRMWNYVEGRCVKTYQGHKNARYTLTGAFGSYGDPANALIASGSEDGAIVVWDVVTKEELQRMSGHKGTVFGVDTHPWRSCMVSCGQDRTIRVWQDEVDPEEKAEQEDQEVDES